MLIFNYGLTIIFFHKISKVLKNGQNKCPILTFQKNFTPKIKIFDTTCEGNFFSAFFSVLKNSPTSCSVSDRSKLLQRVFE